MIRKETDCPLHLLLNQPLLFLPTLCISPSSSSRNNRLCLVPRVSLLDLPLAACPSRLRCCPAEVFLPSSSSASSSSCRNRQYFEQPVYHPFLSSVLTDIELINSSRRCAFAQISSFFSTDDFAVAILYATPNVVSAMTPHRLIRDNRRSFMSAIFSSFQLGDLLNSSYEILALRGGQSRLKHVHLHAL